LIVLLVVTAAGAAYLTLALVQVARFARRRVPRSPETPSITVLKPLHGIEPGLYESLASFCDQAYPDFEIVFCLHDAGDPAAAVAERVAKAHPECRVRIVYGDNPAMSNPKIANLAKPGAEPHGDLVVLADSDIWVGRDYLKAIAASFSSARTGAITCLYGAIPNATLVSQLGALHVEEEYAPSVLVAVALAKMNFCLGATMAVRRGVLEKIGGLEALGAHLADDYALGRLVSDCGYQVELSRYVVRTSIAESQFGQLWHRELRWARINFTLAPAGHAFSFLMYALPFATAYAFATHTAFAFGMLLGVAVLRFGLHAAARATFASAYPDSPWLVPVRDAISLSIWAASLVTRTVRWRGVRHRT
jgi:ceramide glucosyltransferase